MSTQVTTQNLPARKMQTVIDAGNHLIVTITTAHRRSDRAYRSSIMWSYSDAAREHTVIELTPRTPSPITTVFTPVMLHTARALTAAHTKYLAAIAETHTDAQLIAWAQESARKSAPRSPRPSQRVLRAGTRVRLEHEVFKTSKEGVLVRDLELLTTSTVVTIRLDDGRLYRDEEVKLTVLG